jgi:hypothetical protein
MPTRNPDADFGAETAVMKKQWARIPYAVSFQAGTNSFTLVTLHIIWGKQASDRTPESRGAAKAVPVPTEGCAGGGCTARTRGSGQGWGTKRGDDQQQTPRPFPQVFAGGSPASFPRGGRKGRRVGRRKEPKPSVPPRGRGRPK